MNQKILLIILEIGIIIIVSSWVIGDIKAYREHKASSLKKEIVINLFYIIGRLLLIGLTVHQIYLSLQP